MREVDEDADDDEIAADGGETGVFEGIAAMCDVRGEVRGE